jgi:hypothetical protein
VIFASDVIFAVYRNFTLSSNMLGKAAAFERPILVADGHLMGQRVTQYGIGLVVPDNDVKKMYVSLQQLLLPATQLTDNFRAYRRDFSVDALGKRLISCLQEGIKNNSLGAK